MNNWKHVYKKNLSSNQYVLVGVMNDEGILLLDSLNNIYRRDDIVEYSYDWYITDIERNYLVIDSPKKIYNSLMFYYREQLINFNIEDHNYEELLLDNGNSIGCRSGINVIYFYYYE